MKKAFPQTEKDIDCVIKSYERRCAICGRGIDITKSHFRIHIVDGGTQIASPDHPEGDIDPAGNLQWLPVGGGCVRKHGLQKYATEFQALEA